MPEALSKLERSILDYLIEYVREHTYQPSIREIGRRFDIKSTKTVSEHLQALADKGWVERDPSRSRGVRILGLDLAGSTVSVPWYGAVAPEEPWLRPEAHLGTYALDGKLAVRPGAFLLTMRGNAMMPAIADGDLLLVTPIGPADLVDGDLVVARLQDGVTVARYRRRVAGASLQPDNIDFPSALIASSTDMHLIGRIVYTLREFRHARAPAPEPAAASQRSAHGG